MEYTIDPVVKGIIIHNGKALIIRRADDDEFGGGTWEFVGGKIEFAEELDHALTREIKEETGLEVRVDRILYATTFLTHTKRQVIILKYLCYCQNDQVYLSAEHSAYKWCTVGELKKYLPNPIIQDLEKNDVFPLLERVLNSVGETV